MGFERVRREQKKTQIKKAVDGLIISDGKTAVEIANRLMNGDRDKLGYVNTCK